MTASLACQCHVLPKENGRILPFTETSWTKFVECTSKWRVLDAEKEKEVAELAHHVISNYSKSNVDLHVYGPRTGLALAGLGYHRNCYRR